MKSNIRKGIENPRKFLVKLAGVVLRGSIKMDRLYLKLMYNTYTNKTLDFEQPKTYNEKLQWLKIYDRNPIYTKMVDKYEVREFIKRKIGGCYLNELHGVWNNFDEIKFNELPQKFVLKCTHDSGGLIICEDKTKLNIKEAKKKIQKSMKKNFYYYTREWPYKNVKPRIICEKYLEQNDTDELRDYRFFCFNGEPKFIALDFSITDKERTRRNLYDMSWNILEKEIAYPKEKDIIIERPHKLDEMISLSKILSRDIPHARIDFYYINNEIVFGEITLYHQSGFGNIRPEEFNREMGDWINLPDKYEEDSR